jgi:uncharacterized protein YxjI
MSKNKVLARIYFWRTKQQQEIDFVEDIGGKISGYEFKWADKKRSAISKTFTEAYNASGVIIDRGNFRDFVII